MARRFGGPGKCDGYMRLIVILVGLAASLLGWTGTDVATAPVNVMTTCHYDSPQADEPTKHGASDRGQPVTARLVSAPTGHAAGGLGAASRSAGSRAPAGGVDYDKAATVFRTGGAAAATNEPTGVANGGCAVLDRTGVAANTGTRTGPPRDTLGRFTSGAGGESATTAAGRSAHANYANTLGGGNYVFNRALPGSRLRPDAVDYSQNIVRELKPGTPAAISRGWRQVNQYKAYLEERTGQPWTAYVDVYTP